MFALAFVFVYMFATNLATFSLIYFFRIIQIKSQEKFAYFLCFVLSNVRLRIHPSVRPSVCVYVLLDSNYGHFELIQRN